MSNVTTGRVVLTERGHTYLSEEYLREQAERIARNWEWLLSQPYVPFRVRQSRHWRGKRFNYWSYR